MRRTVYGLVAMLLLVTGVLAYAQPLAHAETTTTKYLNGKIFYGDFDSDALSGDIHVINSDGSGEVKISPSGSNHDALPALSPDGSKIVYLDYQNLYQLYTMDVDGSNRTQLTNEPDTILYPSWSPNGQKIAFAEAVSGINQVFIMDADGSDVTQLTNATDDKASGPAWSPDGTEIAYTTYNNTTSESRLNTIDADGSNHAYVGAAADLYFSPTWSPDGQKIVFGHTPVGGEFMSIYTINRDGTNLTKVSQSADGEFNPLYSADGKKILFEGLAPVTNSVGLYLMNTDGTDRHLIKTIGGSELPVLTPNSWQLLPYENTANPDGTNTSTIASTDNYSSALYDVDDKESLVVDGTIGGVTVTNGGTLKGSGNVGVVDVKSGGFIAPGHSPGCLNSGNFTLSGTYQAELGGTTACSGYDQMKVTGTVTLTGGTLNANLYGSYAPKAGDGFTIIDNDGADAVVGTFNGLAQGASYTAGGTTYTVSYTGGDGNDVVLTVAAPGAPDTGFRFAATHPLQTLAISTAFAAALLAASRRYRSHTTK